MGKKEGQKNGGDNKVAPAPAENKDDVSVTAVYKIGCNCVGCADKVKNAVSDFEGVEVVKSDCGAIKVTVKGTNVDPTAIREKLEKKLKKKKVELVSPQPKKEGGGGGGNKKPEEKKPEEKEERKKPKEKEGEKNGGDNKVAPAPVPAEKKDDVSVTAVYKIDCNCEGCTKILKKVKKAVSDFDGVEVVKTDCGAIKWTVKGTNIDPTAIREKLEEKIEKKVELVSPQPKKGGGGGGRGGDKKPEEKKAEKKEEPKKPKEKEGEKNGGDNKVAPAPVPAEKKDDVSVTAVYKIDCNCEGCTKILKKVKKAVSDFDGVEVVKTDYGAIKWTVKGTNIDPTAIREKLEEKIEKKVELVSPQPKKGGGGGGRGGDKKPEEKKAEKKEEPKKPKEKEGEKNGGDNKVAPAPVPAEKKDDVSVTAVYKIDCNCEGCTKILKKVKKAVSDFDGVEVVKTDCGAIKWTVKGTNIDPTAIREKLEEKIEKKVELVSPQPKKGGGSGGRGGDKKPEEKKAEKKEEPKKPKEKEGEKNGGDNKVAPAPVPAEKKDNVSVTAVYKIDCNCEGCTKILKKVKKAVSDFDGVEVVKTDYGAIKWTVKGTNIDPTAIREKLEEKIEKKVELVSPQPKKGGGGGGRGGDKKPEEKKAEKKEEPKKPKEKEGEKNGGDNKVAPVPVPAEKKDNISVTAVYKIDCNCEGCTKILKKVKKAVSDFDGVEVVKTDCGAIKWTVKGTNIDPTAIREKLEEKIEKKVELVSPHPKKGGGGSGCGGDKKPEKKKAEKKEEPKKPKEKEGEKNSGDNKVAPAPVPAEKKDDVSVTAVYKINCNCDGWTKKLEKVKKAVLDFDGVEEVKTDGGAYKLTVKGTNVDLTAIREKLEEEMKKKVELVSPQPKKDGSGSSGNKKPEEKKAEKKEEPKIPEELRDELHKETLQPARENLENEPPIMEPRNQLHPQDGSSQSWYPPSVVSSPNSSPLGTPSSASSSSFSSHRTSDRPQSPSHVSPAEAAGVIAVLKDKSVDELQKLLSDKDAYHHFLLSLDQVKIQNNLRDELRKETLQLARENLEKEPRIMGLRNQCRIIQTTELAAAQEKLNELERKKEETLKFYSPQSPLQRLQDAMNKTEEESENLHKQLLDRDVDLGTFVQKYKKLRTTYHWRALIHLSAKTSSIG